MTRLSTLAALLGLFFALAATAQADVEPNDYIYQAEGPISGGTKITGAIAAGDLGDDYVFYVQGITQLHLTGPADNGCTTAELRDTDGNGLPNDYTTPAGTNRFFVAVYYYDNDYDCTRSSGYNYSFQLDPGSAVVTGAGKQPIVDTGEPNEDSAHAWGPLAAGSWYKQTLETSNDADWLLFYTAPGPHQIDIQTTRVNDPSWCSDSFELMDANGVRIESASPRIERIAHIAYTSQDAQTLYLRRSTSDSDCVGDSALVQVGPADAISATPPAPVVDQPSVETPVETPVFDSGPSASCLSAQGQVRHWTRSVRKTKRQLRNAHGARKHSLKRKLGAEMRTLRRARDRVAIRC
jgi:hypothetical protein